ncbi:MAG: hypothetical protein WB586_18630 [Chthoniobacterales bacterium]
MNTVNESTRFDQRMLNGTVPQDLQDKIAALTTYLNGSQGAIGDLKAIADFLSRLSTDFPALPPAPQPVRPGHEVTEDPDLSCTTKATCFGLDYGTATDDLGDMSRGKPLKGFFIDPATGSNYVTHVKTVRGASIPREVLLSTFLGVDAWQTRGIGTIWDQYANDLEHWVLANQPTLDIDSGGKYSILSVPIVDAGPSADTHNGLDLTYLASHDLATEGSAFCTYRIMVKGEVVPIKGWNFTNKRVIGS